MTEITTAQLADAESYARAVTEATEASAAYYSGGDSRLDDATYDRLARAIAAYEAEHPAEIVPASPTGKVAGGAVPAGEVEHSARMMSLDNVFDGAELSAWADSLAKRLGGPVTGGYAVEPKLDGVAVAARYREGRLVQLVTRGDGSHGEDVSHAIGTIAGLPDRLDTPVTFEVRGEVLLTTEQFEQANLIRAEFGATPFANPRNGAAGTLRAKERPYVIEMTFWAYSGLPLEDGSAELAALAHSRVMEIVAEAGVQTTAATPVGLRTCASIEEVQSRVEEIAALRAALPFGIDGVVIKADDPADQEKAGFSSRAPRWAIAYKLPAVERVTRLLAVEWNVGRTGVIAPRAVLEPVEIDGSTVTYATLHNPADITRRDLRIGDQVTVYKAGDIIPRIEAPVVQLRTGAETPIDFPTECPRCASDIDTTQERWRCVRGRECGQLASIRYAVARDCLDIDGMGQKLVTQLVESGQVTDFADVFTLDREQVLALDRMGEVSADKLLATIAAAKDRPLNRVFCALGVLGTGRSISRRIARHFGTMEAIRAADAAALEAVAGIGAEKARVVVAQIAELAPLIDKLTAAGVNMTEPGVPARMPGDGDADGAAEPQEAVPAGPLADLTVVVTGSMTGALAELSRTAMNELIESAGGRASSSVSKKTGLLVAGEKAGSKRAKAAELGIRVIAPEEFAELLGDLIP
ncbi:NAD-dependent DNA ligase LigA [Streptomyces sp. SID13666]|uniref:NAD-dependent DNA ligase LigA n=1 Tax=unclassified Streptomyces TaxID=2593676 RepID=UPI0013BF0D08|nr:MULTISPECIES: NAD-dependent DNA ligase LigA [unclassified Streptomyces]NEA58716.1 NAD-dependent DNA ligase LigA [Streptomyces sp. SID13666]NEA70143.1 NAD-dependent DNA ligase LigA [Streptomyces sp. SID13588]